MLVIFDLDGTLVDSFEAHYLGFKEILRDFGIELKRERLKELFGIDAEKIVETIFKEHEKTIDKSIISEIINKKAKLTEKYSKFIKIQPGIKEMLDYLKKRGIKLAIFSNSSRGDVEKILETVGLREYFDLVLTSNDVKNKKPDPEGLLKIIHILGERKNDVIYVGDKTIDEEAAKRCGIKFFYISEFLKRYRELL